MKQTKLNTWLSKNGLDYKNLAEHLKVDKTTAFKYCNGTRKLSLEKALKIEELTRGEVKCKDLI